MRTDLWAKFYAAALSHNALDTKQAARQADKAMEEYDARAKTLKNHEREVAELSRDLELARHQRDEATAVLINMQRFVADVEQRPDTSAWAEVRRTVEHLSLNDVNRVLKLRNKMRYYILPRWMEEPGEDDTNNPLLK